jgi:hypothetical protein
MADSNKSVTELIKQAGSIPEYQQMMNYLSTRGAAPTIAADPKLNFSGIFRPGPTFSAPGSVGIRPKEPVEALIHEVTHAADIQMVSQYMQESGRTSSSSAGPFKSTPFTDAYDKLDPAPLTKLMQPEWAGRASKYRATRPESRAFAIENAIGPNVTKDSVTRAPGHVDATIATEFMILLELAQRSSGKPAAKTTR